VKSRGKRTLPNRSHGARLLLGAPGSRKPAKEPWWVGGGEDTAGMRTTFSVAGWNSPAGSACSPGWPGGHRSAGPRGESGGKVCEAYPPNSGGANCKQQAYMDLIASLDTGSMAGTWHPVCYRLRCPGTWLAHRVGGKLRPSSKLVLFDFLLGAAQIHTAKTISQGCHGDPHRTA